MYKAHPLIKFDTVYEESEWKIFAAFMANAEEAQGPVFKYHQFINAKDEEEFNSFIQEVMLRSFIKTTVDVTPEDNLLTLSTCDYSIPEGRFVVMARKVRKGESKRVDTEGAEANELPMYPQAWYTMNNVSMPDFSNLSSEEEVPSEEPPAESSGDVTQPSEEPPIVSQEPSVPPPVISQEPVLPPVVSEEPPPLPPVSEEPVPPPVSSEEPTPPPVSSEEPVPPPVSSEEPPAPQVSEEPPTPADVSQEPAPENIE